MLKRFRIALIHTTTYSGPNQGYDFHPTNLRNAKARDEALVILKKHGHVNLKEDFRTVLIKLNPKLIPSVANANLANLD